LLSLEKTRLHDALENGRYDQASTLMEYETEDYLTKCYENYTDYEPPSNKSCLHIMAGLADELQAVGLCREFFGRVTDAEVRGQLLNATVVEEVHIGSETTRARMTAIHKAAYSGNSEVVRLLCQEFGVDAQCNTSETFSAQRLTGITPLYWAAAKGHEEVAKLLIGIIGDVNVSCTDQSDMPLHVACLYGHSDLVKWFLDNNANVNATRVTDGATALFIAAENGHHEVVNLLLGHKADVNAARNTGATPLFIAAINGYCKVVKLLLQNKADVNISRNTGATPLYISAWKGHTEIVELLLDHEAEINASKITGETPLYVAAQNGHVQTVKLLLARQADVNKTRQEDGSRPIDAAQRYRHLDIVKLLQ